MLRRLSRPLKIRGFLVGPSRCDAKFIVLLTSHISSGKLVAGFPKGNNPAFGFIRDHFSARQLLTKRECGSGTVDVANFTDGVCEIWDIAPK